MSLPLEGIRILDLTRLLPGGYASQMMADFGADVIKVEEPGVGDYARSMEPLSPAGLGIAFLATNRNKRSISLNLKLEQGRAIFRTLVKQADVVLESYRPGVLERLGLGYESLKEINPALIYCAISGYGQDGPYKYRAGHDLNYVGYAGLLSHNVGPHGEPVMPATQIGDLAGGSHMAVIGILTALLGRARTGIGRMVDVSMTEGAMALLPLFTAEYLNTGKVPQPGRSTLGGGLPCYNIYETSDGKYVTLAALEPKFWQIFCTRSGHPELLPLHMPSDAAERDETMHKLQIIFKTKTRDEWVSELGELDTCVGPVYSIDEALNDPQARARGMNGTHGDEKQHPHIVPTLPRISEVEQEQRYAPPQLGQHSAVILQEAGYSVADIERFAAEGVI
ncbi:MAG: CaiB/BaiF CoA-transferase family protein [Ktedonobacteraceae bacterium]